MLSEATTQHDTTRIGNAVGVDAGRALARKLLVCDAQRACPWNVINSLETFAPVAVALDELHLVT